MEKKKNTRQHGLEENVGTGARNATRHTVHVPSFSPAPFPPSSRALHRREAVTARLSFNSGLSEGPAMMLGSLLSEVCGLPLPFKRNQTLILEYVGSRWTRRSREPLVSADIRVWLEGSGEGRVPQGIRTGWYKVAAQPALPISRSAGPRSLLNRM